MKKKSVFFVAAVALMGAAAAVLRSWNLTCGFEEATGLAARNAAATVIPLIAIICMAAAVFVGSLLCGKKYTSCSTIETAFAFGHVSQFYVLVLGCLLCGAGGLGRFLGLNGIGGGQRLFGALQIVTAICFCLIGLDCYRGKKSKHQKFLTAIAAIAICTELVAYYKLRSSSPILMEYGFGIVGLSAATLSAYLMCGYSYGFAKTKRMLFCLGVTGIFCVMHISECVGTLEILSCVGESIICFSFLNAFCASVKKK